MRERRVLDVGDLRVVVADEGDDEGRSFVAVEGAVEVGEVPQGPEGVE